MATGERQFAANRAPTARAQPPRVRAPAAEGATFTYTAVIEQARFWFGASSSRIEATIVQSLAGVFARGTFCEGRAPAKHVESDLCVELCAR